jgi:HK97 family phage portal protein
LAVEIDLILNHFSRTFMPSFFARLFGAGAPSSAPITQAAAQPSDTKQSRAGALLALHSTGLSRWTPRTYVELTRHGFERNPIVYRCVRLIAEAAASIPWMAFRGTMEDDAHPALRLMQRPNPSDSNVTFIEQIYADLMLFGNAYVEAVSLDGMLREIYALRPDRMSIAPGQNGWPSAYDYMVMGDKVRFNLVAGQPAPILHIKYFHPLDDHYGLAPIAPAQTALEVHNAAGLWNKTLLENAACPSGALVYAGPAGASLSEDQFERLRRELDENFAGQRNAGRPLLLEGGLDWKALSLTPKDMDFIQAKNTAAREIALAFGVPPLLLGLPGDNTHANFQEANRAFWRQTIIPLVVRTQSVFQNWMQDYFGQLRFDYNIDRIDALAEDRASEWARVNSATFITPNEKREAVGYAPLANKNELDNNSMKSFDELQR